MEVIVAPFKDDTSRLRSMGITFLTFSEKYSLWVASIKKRSKAGLLTPEIFSLSYDSTLSDLKNALFVYLVDEEQLSSIDREFNIIEYV